MVSLLRLVYCIGRLARLLRCTYVYSLIQLLLFSRKQIEHVCELHQLAYDSDSKNLSEVQQLFDPCRFHKLTLLLGQVPIVTAFTLVA